MERTLSKAPEGSMFASKRKLSVSPDRIKVVRPEASSPIRRSVRKEMPTRSRSVTPSPRKHEDLVVIEPEYRSTYEDFLVKFIFFFAIFLVLIAVILMIYRWSGKEE